MHYCTNVRQTIFESPAKRITSTTMVTKATGTLTHFKETTAKCITSNGNSTHYLIIFKVTNITKQYDPLYSNNLETSSPFNGHLPK